MNLIEELTSKGIIKYGDFTLKSGKRTDVYFNLREICSYPELLAKVSDAVYIAALNKISIYDFDLICGVAYTGIPMATYLSTRYRIPMIVCKKERKTYGMMTIVDGTFKKGDRVLLIDDLITDGQSKMETINVLKTEGLNVVTIALFFY